MAEPKQPTPGKVAEESAIGQAVEPGSAAQRPLAADSEVTAFVAAMREAATLQARTQGRLVFAMDATMSRQPTWDMALALQADMFAVVDRIGGLEVQLVFFRGAGECRSSRWVSDAAALARLMTTVSCAGGYTQLGKVLSHARRETEHKRVSALVYVGDCMEEDVDDICGRAGELALHGVPAFVFQEGRDTRAEQCFREIARLTKGAYCRFDAGSAAQLRELLQAVAIYAAGGRKALLASPGKGARLLIEQMR